MITEKYLLIIMIPCYLDAKGRRLVDELWHKDLLLHLDQIAELTLAAPLRTEPPPEGVYLPIEPAPGQGSIRFVDLPPCRSTLAALATLPAAAARIWKALGQTEVLHANIGGWPISYGWIAVPMARLRGKFVLTVMESAGWRTGWGPPWTLKGIARAVVFEPLARLCVNLAHLPTFTHAGYRDQMLFRGRQGRGQVVSASWIDPEVILDDATANADWDARLADPDRPLRVVFAGNLLAAKGVDVLLQALETLDRRADPLHVRIHGVGDRLEACVETSKRLEGRVRLELRGKIAYGPKFFEMLRSQDVLVVPSLSDEQPRVVFDAFSQGLPVIASGTPGLRQCVTEGVDGRIVPAGDPAALAEALSWAARHRDRLRALGIAGLDVARSLTHDEMHRRRAALIREALDAERRPAGAASPA